MTKDTITIEFEQEALPHMNALYTFAVRLCRDRDEGQDLVQETYMKAFRFFDKFERGTNCKAWLFRILKNTYINKYRRDNREPDKVEYDAVEEFYESVKSEYTDTSNLEQKLFSTMLDDEVMSAIESLPEDFRTVILLCDIEEFTYEEIAEFLDCPIGTVRSRLHRARNILAAKLAGYAQSRGYTNGTLSAE
ncbi:MAG: sigma-70 family RNA polymerase sigma factor [Candidatus Kapabacteria bacterium]|nr:sigma-70 family RNA polymerase sigma factor [Candidatus Kapabacteria bacterium]